VDLFIECKRFFRSAAAKGYGLGRSVGIVAAPLPVNGMNDRGIWNRADTLKVGSKIRDKACDRVAAIELCNRYSGDNESFLIRVALIKTNGQSLW
jgi:hypothetical protein